MHRATAKRACTWSWASEIKADRLGTSSVLLTYRRFSLLGQCPDRLKQRQVSGRIQLDTLVSKAWALQIHQGAPLRRGDHRY